MTVINTVALVRNAYISSPSDRRPVIVSSQPMFGEIHKSVEPNKVNPVPSQRINKTLRSYGVEKTLDLLEANNIKAVIFDLDGTLSRNLFLHVGKAPHGFLSLMRKVLIFTLDYLPLLPGLVPSKSKELLNQLEKAKIPVAIVSNNPSERYTQKIQKVLGCPLFNNAKKPDTAILLKAINLLKTDHQLPMNTFNHQVAMIGDEPGIDIKAGNDAGMFTVLVKSLK